MIAIVVIGVTLSGCSLFKKSSPKYSVSLEIWGAFDDSEDYTEIFSTYANINPLVESVTFRKFSTQEYEAALLDALAAGTGPDIFMIRNSQIPEFLNKIVPAPSGMISERRFNSAFVDVVADDVVVNGEIYGLPLSVDSLALYYNKDFFNAAGIAAPPQTWQEFASVVERLSQIDQYGNIQRAGAAFGTGKNINRSADVIAALFMQNGVPITSNNGNVVLSSYVESTDGVASDAAIETLRFYTNFASPSRSVYTWNPRQHYSIDAFTEGRVGMMINYSWHYNTIKHKNEKLRFAVAPLPQINRDAPKNIANYQVFVVAKNKTMEAKPGKKPLPQRLRIHEAWEFLSYLTLPHNGRFRIVHGITGQEKVAELSIDPAENYLLRTGKPAARRDLVEAQKDDAILGPFAYGNLIAQTYRRFSPDAVDAIFVEMIDSVVVGQRTVSQALANAKTQMVEIFQRAIK